jgi:hypothetical protein
MAECSVPWYAVAAPLERSLRRIEETAKRCDNGVGEEKAKYDILLVVKQCRVSFRNADGIEHAAAVEARTLYEAVGLAIDRFRRCEYVRCEPNGLHEFTVEPREPDTQHLLTRRCSTRGSAARRIARGYGAQNQIEGDLGRRSVRPRPELLRRFEVYRPIIRV